MSFLSVYVEPEPPIYSSFLVKKGGEILKKVQSVCFEKRQFELKKSRER